MELSELLSKANEMAGKYGLKVEDLGVDSVGVKGDGRVYLPVLLVVGPFPGWDVLGQLSDELTNGLEISRVSYDTSGIKSKAEAPNK